MADAGSRLKEKAEQVVAQIDVPMQQLLSELSATRLKNAGVIVPIEIQSHHVRWTLEWKKDSITYRLRIVVRLSDDGRESKIDQVLVQNEASTPFNFDGHTPTTMMKRITGLDFPKIREAAMMLIQG